MIGIDENETFISTKEDNTRLCSKYNLIDPIATHYGNENEPNTYILGSKQIDFIFCSKEIPKFTTACGMTPLGHILSSDHRSLFIDINVTQYLSNIFIDAVNNNSRLLQSNHPKKVKQYKKSIKIY